MVQEFNVLRCYGCNTFQVDQVLLVRYLARYFLSNKNATYDSEKFALLFMKEPFYCYLLMLRYKLHRDMIAIALFVYQRAFQCPFPSYFLN